MGVNLVGANSPWGEPGMIPRSNDTFNKGYVCVYIVCPLTRPVQRLSVAIAS